MNGLNNIRFLSLSPVFNMVDEMGLIYFGLPAAPKQAALGLKVIFADHIKQDWDNLIG